MGLGPLASVRVFVRDLAAARAFYEAMLGLPVQHADENTAVYAPGGAMLVVEPCDPADAEAAALVGRFTGVSFAVADIVAEHARLSAAGVRFEAAPAKQDWGGSLAHFHDPDGNVLSLVEFPEM